MKKNIIRALGIVALAAAAWYGYHFFQQLPQRQQQVATTRVRKGDVIIRAYARGELRAVRSVTLTAPNLFGTVQVTKLAPMGSLAKEKDLIVEFDDSERRAQLEETLLEVEQIDEQVKQKQAELAIRNNQDQVDLLRARYSVRRAELEVQRNPLLSEIDAKKNQLTLEESRRRLKQLESDIKSRQEQALAELAVLRETRNKSMIDVAREQQRIAQTRMLASMTGLVAVKQNRGGAMFFGQQLPDIREGDTIYPGTAVADILDLSELEVVAKVGELDRANLHEGQDVIMELDAISGKKFHGKIKGMSGTASANIWSGDPAKKFDVLFSIDMRQLLKGLGAKPEQIERIMKTAEQNAKKAPPSSAQSASLAMFMGGGPGGTAGGMSAGGQGGMQGGEAGGGNQMMVGGQGGMQQGGLGEEMRAGGQGDRSGRGEGYRMRGGGGVGGSLFAQIPEADRQKFREAFQKELAGKSMRELSPEDRQKVFEKAAKTAGIKLPQGMVFGGRQGSPGGQPGRGSASAAGAPGGRPGMEMGGPGGPSIGLTGFESAPAAAASLTAALGTEEERAKAQLPLPPEEDTQLDVLLRPGLLADVEIIVEKIPNAIHIPNQALFEKEGKLIAYVKVGGRFEPRPVTLLKRSESTVVVQDGLRPNEIVALADPTLSKKDQKKTEGKAGAGSMPGMGGGGGGSEGGRKGGR